MHLFRNQAFGLASLGLITGFTMSAMQGCDEVAGDLIEQCGLGCPDEGILEGNASIRQAFADELFRVFVAAHPAIRVTPINTEPAVADMIRRVVAAGAAQRGAS